jgi:hypothetical protein
MIQLSEVERSGRVLHEESVRNPCSFYLPSLFKGYGEFTQAMVPLRNFVSKRAPELDYPPCPLTALLTMNEKEGFTPEGR